MLENATRICDAKFGTLYRYDDGTFSPVAQFGAPPALCRVQQRSAGRLYRKGRNNLGRAIADKGSGTQRRHAWQSPTPGAAARFGGARSLSLCRCSRMMS